MRLGVGLGIVRFGGFIARVSTGIAGLLTAIFMILTVLEPFFGGSHPEPFAPFGEEVGYLTWAWQTIVVIVGYLVIGRVVLGGLIVGLGCRLLPADYRALYALPMDEFEEAATALVHETHSLAR